MSGKRMVRLVLPAMVAVVPAVVGISTTARAVGVTTHVTACGTTITQAGNYDLIGSLGPCSGNGVTILASDVVLDLSGYSIQGPGASVSSAGILVLGSGDTITSSVGFGRVGGFAVGVDVDLATGTLISNMSGWNDGEGYRFSQATGTTCASCYASGDVDGFSILSSSGTTLHGVTASSNGNDGIRVVGSSGTVIGGNEVGSSGSNLPGNFADWNAGDGIYLGGGSTPNLATEITNVRVVGNGNDGIDNMSVVPVTGTNAGLGTGTTVVLNAVGSNNHVWDIYEAATACAGDVFALNSVLLGSSIKTNQPGCVR